MAKECAAPVSNRSGQRAIDHRVALILLQDATGSKSARIGALDTAGASLKAYMYRLFADPARIFGVRDMKKTTKTAKQLIARVDAAKKAGLPMTVENLKKLDYVRAEGDGWDLPIPAVKCLPQKPQRNNARSFTRNEGSDRF